MRESKYSSISKCSNDRDNDQLGNPNTLKKMRMEKNYKE